MFRLLFQITQHFKEYIVFSGLVSISLLLLFLGNTSNLNFTAQTSVEIVGAVKHISSILPDFRNLRIENRELRRANVKLLVEVSQLREEKAENSRLRSLLNFKEKQSGFELIPADVIGKNLSSPYGYMVLNVGTADGVEVNMPVICEYGIVGKIMKASKNYSLVMILYHRDFRTSVKIQRTRVDGILGWEGGEYLSLMNVPKTTDVRVGDVVITSEYSTIFPSGFEVGVVVKIDNSVPGLFKSIKVKPLVDFSKVEEVFVIRYKVDNERLEIDRLEFAK